VRRIFKQFRIRKIATQYSVANGRAKTAARAAPRAEVLITNVKRSR